MNTSSAEKLLTKGERAVLDLLVKGWVFERETMRFLPRKNRHEELQPNRNPDNAHYVLRSPLNVRRRLSMELAQRLQEGALVTRERVPTITDRGREAHRRTDIYGRALP